MKNALKFVRRLNQHRNEYIATFFATLSIFMVVCSSAWSSPALPKLLLDPNPPVRITEDDGSWILAVTAIGGMIGPIFTGLTVDRYGRKWPLIGCVAPVVAGWIMIGLTSTKALLYVSRVLFGMAYGTAYSIAPIYLGEISSDAIRGSTGSIVTLMAKIAILMQYSVGPYVSFRALAWVSMVGPALFLATFVWMPESPYYLIAKERYAEARRCLQWLRQTESVDEELESMVRSVKRSNEEKASPKELFVAHYRNNLIIVVVLAFGTQLAGTQAILGYAQIIFGMISTDLGAAEMSIILGAVQLATVLFPIFLVDRVGRRPLMLWSAAGSAFGLLICSVYFTLAKADVDVEGLGWFPFVGLLLFVIAYALGLATVTFAILSEIFPKNIRAYANAVYAMLSAIFIFGVVKLFQVASDNVGPFLPFWIFCICTVVTFVFVYVFIPETKGRPLDEVQSIIANVRKK